MTTSEEWSIAFDLAYNNISSNQAPGLTNYEKSIFLTQAQEALILDLYKGTTGDAFETTEEVTRYLCSLVIKADLKPISDNTSFVLGINTYNVELPNDVWFIVYQSGRIECNGSLRDVLVVPTIQDNLFKTLKNPFTGPNINKMISTSEEGKITLYSKEKCVALYIKYLKRPNNIDLEVDNPIVDVPESLHNQILMRAVQLAKAVWHS